MKLWLGELFTKHPVYAWNERKRNSIHNRICIRTLRVWKPVAVHSCIFVRFFKKYRIDADCLIFTITIPSCLRSSGPFLSLSGSQTLEVINKHKALAETAAYLRLHQYLYKDAQIRFSPQGTESRSRIITVKLDIVKLLEFVA